MSLLPASHLWNNIIQKVQGNSLSPRNRNCLCSFKITWHALTKQARVIHKEYFKSFNLLPKILGILTFGVIIVIHGSNFLSESQIDQSYYSQYSLYNVDTMKHTIGGKMAQGVPFCPRVGANWSNYIFSLYLGNMIIYANISWLTTCIVIVSRFLPNIMIIGWILLQWDQFFLSYAIFSPTSLTTMNGIMPSFIQNIYKWNYFRITRYVLFAYFEDVTTIRCPQNESGKKR